MKTITIKVHNSKWKVKHVDTLETEGSNPAGITDRATKTVYLNKTFDVEFRNTLIHELVHVFAVEYGFAQTLFNDETLAEFIAAYLDDIYKLTNHIEQKLLQQ